MLHSQLLPGNLCNTINRHIHTYTFNTLYGHTVVLWCLLLMGDSIRFSKASYRSCFWTYYLTSLYTSGNGTLSRIQLQRDNMQMLSLHFNFHLRKRCEDKSMREDFRKKKRSPDNPKTNEAALAQPYWGAAPFSGLWPYSPQFLSAQRGPALQRPIHTVLLGP